MGNKNINKNVPDIKKINQGQHKERQYSIIVEHNPMTDDYHTGIRSVDDIHTLKEILEDYGEDGAFTPDYSFEDAEKALSLGVITVYSSYQIEPGVFVTPSRLEAETYTGGGKVFSKEVPIDDIAWIDVIEGQYAPA